MADKVCNDFIFLVQIMLIKPYIKLTTLLLLTFSFQFIDFASVSIPLIIKGEQFRFKLLTAMQKYYIAV